MAVGNVKGFKVTKGNETGIAKIATEAYLDKSVTKAKLAQAVQDTLDDVENKADQDGDYDSLTAGGAKQLLSTVYVDDNEPYNFRTAGGSADIGDRMYEEVVGGSIVWNELYVNANFATASGWSANNESHATTSVSNNVLTLTLGSNAGSSTYLARYLPSGTKLINGHVYLQTIEVNSLKSTLCRFLYPAVSENASNNFSVSANVWTKTGQIIKMTANNSSALFYFNWSGSLSEGDTVQFKNAFLCDLTQMFGSTIADYIYSLEQGTAGAGVAWFRKLFPKPYYEYNEGELMSVKAGSHDTVGFNQFDKSTAVDGKYINPNTGAEVNSGAWVRSDYIRVVPNTVYYTNADGTGSTYPITLFDADKNFIGMVGEPAGPRTFNTGDARYVILSTLKARTSVDDLVLNLAWDGERNGEYEAYVKHTYPLAELELRGIPKLDANNQLYYDGDTYASDGTVTRRFGVIDFGDLANDSFVYIDADNYSSWSEDGCRVNINQMKSSSQFRISDGKYTNVGSYQSWNIIPTLGNMVVGTAGQGVIFRNDSFSTAAEFKSALSGVYLVYELATPTTETADTYANPQVVDDFGTEEYTDFAVEAGDRDVAIPVGHNSQYMNNLRAKLEMAPDSPSGDGKYIVQQSNGENAYIPYTADGRLDAIEAKLPAPPSANGTYKLTATVTDGGVTYTWVAG